MKKQLIDANSYALQMQNDATSGHPDVTTFQINLTVTGMGIAVHVSWQYDDMPLASTKRMVTYEAIENAGRNPLITAIDTLCVEVATFVGRQILHKKALAD